MFNENKDYLARKIIVDIFFVDLLITFVSAITILILKNNQKLMDLINIIKAIFSVGVFFIFIFFVFCLVEIILKSKMNEKIKQYIDNKEFNKGIDYIEKLPQIKILYDIYERQFYYIALLSLYLDNIGKAKQNFCKINIQSPIIDTEVFVNTILYMLLIFQEEDCQSKDMELIEKCFNNHIEAIKRNKKQYNKVQHNIIAIQKIIDNDLLNMNIMLYNKLDIPLVKRRIQ